MHKSTQQAEGLGCPFSTHMGGGGCPDPVGYSSGIDAGLWRHPPRDISVLSRLRAAQSHAALMPNLPY